MKKCVSCNAFFDDDAKFCNICGKELVEEAVKEEPAKEEAVTEELNNEAVPAETVEETAAPAEAAPVVEAAEEAAPAATTFTAPDFTPVAKKKFNFKPILFAAIPVILIIAIVLNMTSIVGFVTKNFSTPENYVQFTEEESFGSANATLMSYYGNIRNNLGAKDQYAEADLSIEIGDKAKTMLKSALGGELPELDWVNDLKITMSANMKGENMQYVIGLNIKEEVLATFDVILDREKGKVYISSPELTDEIIEIELDDETVASLSGFAVASNATLEPEDIVKILPDEKTLGKLIDKYIGIVFDCIEEAEKETEEVEVGDITQKLTVLEYTLDQKTVYEIAIAVMKEAKDDKVIEEIVENAIDVLVDKEVFEKDEVKDAYDNFQDNLDETIDSLKEGKKNISDNSDTKIDITSYVNNKNEIVGREIKYAGETLLKYVKVAKGGEFESELKVAGMVKVAGKGTEKGNILNGTYTIKYNDTELCEIEVTDYNTKTAKEGYINGTFAVTPNISSIVSLAGGDTSVESVLSMLDPSIELKLAQSEKQANIELKVNSGDELFVGVYFNATQSGAKKISTPDSTIKIDSDGEYDEEKLENLVKNLKTDALIEKLEKTGVPEDFVTLIKGALESLVSGELGNSVESEVAVPGYDENYYGGYDDSYDDSYGDSYDDSYGGYGDAEDSYGGYDDSYDNSYDDTYGGNEFFQDFSELTN